MITFPVCAALALFRKLLHIVPHYEQLLSSLQCAANFHSNQHSHSNSLPPTRVLFLTNLSFISSLILKH